MSYLIDTDVVADYLKGTRRMSELLNSLLPGGIVISLITYGEIYEGVLFGRNPLVYRDGFAHFLRMVDVVSLSRPIMRRFATVRGELRRRGLLIGDPDLLIAATALQGGLTIVTRNLAHFSRISGLSLYPIAHF